MHWINWAVVVAYLTFVVGDSIRRSRGHTYAAIADIRTPFGGSTVRLRTTSISTRALIKRLFAVVVGKLVVLD